MFNKGKFSEIEEIYKSLKKSFKDNFYIEIQRHNDQNEKLFENYNLNLSKKFEIPIIATHEVFYLKKIIEIIFILKYKDTMIKTKNHLKILI